MSVELRYTYGLALEHAKNVLANLKFYGESIGPSEWRDLVVKEADEKDGIVTYKLKGRASFSSEEGKVIPNTFGVNIIFRWNTAYRKFKETQEGDYTLTE